MSWNNTSVSHGFSEYGCSIIKLSFLEPISNGGKDGGGGGGEEVGGGGGGGSGSTEGLNDMEALELDE